MVNPSVLRLGRTVTVSTLAVILAAAGAWFLVPQVRTSVLPRPTVTSLQPTPSGFVQPSPVAVIEPLLPALDLTPAPAADALRGRVTAQPKGAADPAGLVVIDPTTGTGLRLRAERGFIPASTMKLLTSVAALTAIGPDRRFETTVIGTGGAVTLVGGGDPLLTSKPNADGNSLTDLARQAAAALRKAGRTKVTLNFDGSLYSGPAWHPAWKETYRYSVAPVSALMVDKALLPNGLRQRDPAKAAATAFAALLKRQGVVAKVGGRTKAPDAPVIASVASPPVHAIVAETLLNSDNDAAEHLLRQVALAAGQPGSFVAGAREVRSQLTRLGLWQAPVRVSDGSGLSRDNRVTPLALARLIAAALHQPTLGDLLDDLPVAGATGTLWDRFDDRPELAGRGLVRAKTGSLRDVSSLAGYLITRDGAVLTFAVMTNGVRLPNTNRDWIDRTLARLANCGC